MMAGTATFTIVASTMIMATPTLSMASPSQRPLPSECIAPAGALVACDTRVELHSSRLGFDDAA